MENVINLDNTKLKNDIELDRELDFQENRNKQEFTNIVGKVIDSGTNYVIKALPVSENIKDIILDIKSAFKTKDFKEILKTAVNSTIREGLEVLSLPKNILSDITKISKVAFKGGLSSALSASIDIIANKYLKKSIFSPILDKAIKDIKLYTSSSTFKEKVDIGVNKLLDKTKKFNDLCSKWYDAYEKFDIFNMNNINKDIKKIEPHIVNEKECRMHSNIINNMTNLVNTKRAKLSPMQIQICSNM